MLDACGRHFPGSVVGGGAVGLYVSLSLPDEVDEAELLAAARSQAFVLDGINEHTLTPQPAGLVLGFAASGSEPALLRAMKKLGAEAERLRGA